MFIVSLPSGHQLNKLCIQMVATGTLSLCNLNASTMQIEPMWPPQACKLPYFFSFCMHMVATWLCLHATSGQTADRHCMSGRQARANFECADRHDTVKPPVFAMTLGGLRYKLDNEDTVAADSFIKIVLPSQFLSLPEP